MKNRNWLEVTAKSGVGELYIYGDITDLKWFDEDVTPKDVKQELDKLKNVDSVNIYVNSPGGNVFAGVAIYNEIKRLNKPTIAYVDGIAASIASLIILAADEVVMPLNAMIMVHHPWMVARGNANEFRAQADKLDKISESVLIASYVEKTGLARDKISGMMDDEAWLNAEEAVELGFADRVDAEQKIAASISGANVIFKGTEIALDNFKAFPQSKFTEHQPKKSILSQKQSHEHIMNLLTAQI